MNEHMMFTHQQSNAAVFVHTMLKAMVLCDLLLDSMDLNAPARMREFKMGILLDDPSADDDVEPYVDIAIPADGDSPRHRLQC